MDVHLTMWLVEYVFITLTSNTGKCTFIVCFDSSIYVEETKQ